MEVLLPRDRSPDKDPSPDTVRRAAEGDHTAFAEIVLALAPRWAGVAKALLGDPADVEDVVQEVAIRLFDRLSGWRGTASVATWSYRIAINASRDVQRRRRVADRHRSLTAAIDVAAPPPDFRGADPLASDVIARAVSALPPDLAAVISLRYGADLRVSDVAAALSLPPGTAATRLRRALALLSTTLGPALNLEG